MLEFAEDVVVQVACIEYPHFRRLRVLPSLKLLCLALAAQLQPSWNGESEESGKFGVFAVGSVIVYSNNTSRRGSLPTL